MGWNGSGAYVRLYNWVDDRDASIPITASRMDGEMDDMAAGIQACIAKNGENAATANLPMGGFRHTGVGNGVARNDYASLGQLQDGTLRFAVGGGTANAQTLTLAPSITAYTDGMVINFEAGATNTGNTTLNVNAVGAQSVVLPNGSELPAGAITSGRFYTVIYDSTNTNWILISGASVVDDLSIISADTTDDVVSVVCDSLTTGDGIHVTSNASNGSARNLIFSHNQNVSAINCVPVYARQDAPNEAVLIDQNADGNSILIDAESTTASVILVQCDTVTSGIIFNASNANALTTGKIINAQSNSSDSSSRELVKINNVNSSATGTICLSISQSADNEALEIVSASETVNTLNITAGTTSGNTLNVQSNDLSSGKIAYFYSNSSSTSTRNLVEIINDSSSAVSATCLYLQQDATEPVVNATATEETFGSTINFLACNRSASSGYNFLLASSDQNGTPDTEFILRGDGEGLCDGSFTGGGADYAEYFEWADGNPAGADRRGISVVLDGNKIREATVNDDPLKVIGVVSGNPSVVGDAAWNKWSGKHLRDDFGSYVMEDYEAWEWAADVKQKDGTIKQETYSFAFDAVPEGLEVPDDKKVIIQQRRKLNPEWDPNVEYIPREDRPEWDTVGLMGKLRIRKGQMVSPYWIKMRDISETVEEWLVR